MTSYGIIPYVGEGSSAEFLLLKRRDSYAYIDFMMGKRCDVERMTDEELSMLATYTFDEVYADFNLYRHKSYYNQSNRVNKVMFLYTSNIEAIKANLSSRAKVNKNASDVDMSDLRVSLMWSFPKGRPSSKNELHRDTALREFYEECCPFIRSVRCSNIEDIGTLSYTPLENKYVGDDGVNYFEVYYTLKCHNKESLESLINVSEVLNTHAIRRQKISNETVDYKWFTCGELSGKYCSLLSEIK